MDLGLKRKFALVTGGSYGIGRYIALALAEEGSNVAICARDRDRLEKTVAEIRAKGVQSIGVSADVTVPQGVRNVIQTVIRSWSTIHILVNNVGGGGQRVGTPVEEIAEEVWLAIYNRNALAAIRFTMQVIPFMRKQRWGRVVTIASIQGREGGGRPWYNMAKSAEISLMKTLAMNHDLARDGITFNSVAPGGIIIQGNEWDAFRREDPERFSKVIHEKLPRGRLGTPEEIASAVVFVCSEKASLLNGACIVVDGGESRSF